MKLPCKSCSLHSSHGNKRALTLITRFSQHTTDTTDLPLYQRPMGREVKEEVGIKGLLRETARVPERRDFSTVTLVNIWGQSVLGL